MSEEEIFGMLKMINQKLDRVLSIVSQQGQAFGSKTEPEPFQQTGQ
jgi:hypothetical protein